TRASPSTRRAAAYRKAPFRARSSSFRSWVATTVRAPVAGSRCRMTSWSSPSSSWSSSSSSLSSRPARAGPRAAMYMVPSGAADQLVLAVEDDLHGRQRGDRLHLGERGGPDGAQDGSEGEDDRAPVHRVAPAGSL